MVGEGIEISGIDIDTQAIFAGPEVLGTLRKAVIMKIRFVPKTNDQIKEMLDRINQEDIKNSLGWPLANDHMVELSNYAKHLATFDGRVTSTDKRWKSIPRKSYKGKFGVHFTSSFSNGDSPFAPINKSTNHLSIALCDLEKDFIKLESTETFSFKGTKVVVHDMRGVIGVDAGLSKFDVEIHKGNRYYAAKVLSHGCPTIDSNQYDNFLSIIFNSLNDESISALQFDFTKLQDVGFDVEIAPLPDLTDDSFTDFFVIQNALELKRG